MCYKKIKTGTAGFVREYKIRLLRRLIPAIRVAGNEILSLRGVLATRPLVRRGLASSADPSFEPPSLYSLLLV